MSEESDEDETPVNQKSKGKSAESSDTKVISSIFDLKSFSLLADVLPWSANRRTLAGKEEETQNRPRKRTRRSRPKWISY